MDKINDAIQTTQGESYHQKQDEILLEPYIYICQIAGKGIRSTFSKALDHWLNVPKEKLDLIIDIVHMLHNSSLILDDIQDNSILRRGIPVAHTIYGIPRTLKVATYVFHQAFKKAQLLKHPDATKLVNEQLLQMSRGQGMEIYWRDTYTVPSESDYQLMALQKTGCLFMLCLRLMQLFSTNKENFSKLTAMLGLYFQVLDDYSNLCMQDYTDNKDFCEDLTEGKFSFPIIHAISAKTARSEEILDILKRRTRNIEVKRYCLGLLEESGSLNYTKNVLNILDRQIQDELTRFEPNPYMEDLLKRLSSWKTD